ncbi:hypothetical protein [Pandoraea sputorum]|uniref:hypothetical protein n=1 Tax=Pandoraea sputorum TaxID=93222 RepID=UPI001240F108|nr:hypothetical protein [Pandoraea sputorum]VVE77155.1 hypothetical protein PSP31120_01069 [Pandoraea sputorum]
MKEQKGNRKLMGRTPAHAAHAYGSFAQRRFRTPKICPSHLPEFRQGKFIEKLIVFWETDALYRIPPDPGSG